MSTGILRFGLHDFLNAQPLLVPLLRVQKEAGFKIVCDVPSVLAQMLNAGDLDLAMIPTVEYLKQADRYRLVPDVCIASRGKVCTVLLVAKSPLEDIKTMVLDKRSRTSVALMKLLFGNKLQETVQYDSAGPDLPSMLESHDAALIIGDQAFSCSQIREEVTVYDLSEEWFRQTRKTFVHAVVAVREGINLGESILSRIRSARQEGVRMIPSILENYPGSQGLDPDVCRDYLQNKIIYELGEQEREGMLEFRDRCHQRGLIQQKWPLRFAGD